jgi:hypothetical protein
MTPRSLLPFALFVPALAACGGPAGDWVALRAADEGGESVATGILEVDLDGETLLELTAAGDGPEGALRATGMARLDGAVADLALTGTWTTDVGAQAVAVQGPCEEEGARELVCALGVGEASWTVTWRREGLD